MRQLGIREHEIGAADHERGSVLRVLSPEQTRGDTVDQFGRLYMDSGFLNPELTAQYGPGASAASRQASARDSIDAIIAHESTEASGLSHAEAIQRSGYCLIDPAECSPSRAVAKKARNEANEKRWLTF